MSEVFGARLTVISGLLISTSGMILLLLTTGVTTLLWMSLSLALVGGGIGMVSGPAQVSALPAVPRDQSGVAAGILSTMRYLGGIVGIAIISILLTRTDAAGMLQQNLFCFGIYLGVYVFALLLAFTLPGRR
jgi:MFS family permease